MRAGPKARPGPTTGPNARLSSQGVVEGRWWDDKDDHFEAGMVDYFFLVRMPGPRLAAVRISPGCSARLCARLDIMYSCPAAVVPSHLAPQVPNHALSLRPVDRYQQETGLQLGPISKITVRVDHAGTRLADWNLQWVGVTFLAIGADAEDKAARPTKQWSFPNTDDDFFTVVST